VKVGLRLQAILRRYRPAGLTGDVIEMDLDNGATVRDAALADVDRVRIFPPVVGGL
jgi:molybdopterin converting factor small subunit